MSDILDQLHEEMALGEQTATVPVGAPTTLPTDVSRPEMAAAAVIESEGGIAFHPSFASFGARLVGLVIDVIVLTLLCVPGMLLLTTGSGVVVVLGVVLIFVGFCIATMLYARGVSRTGQGLGNRIAKTRVVDVRNGHLISAGDAGTRYVIRMLISTIFFVGFLVAFGNSQRRTFHDNVAGTVVTRPARASWSIDDEPMP